MDRPSPFDTQIAGEVKNFDPAPAFHDPGAASGYRLGCRGAEGDNHLRPDQFAFDIEPPLAALDLMCIRSLVQAPLAARHVFEMLNRVGDVGCVAVTVRVQAHDLPHLRQDYFSITLDRKSSRVEGATEPLRGHFLLLPDMPSLRAIFDAIRLT